MQIDLVHLREDVRVSFGNLRSDAIAQRALRLLRGFMPADLAGDTAAAAMNFLRGL